MCLTPNRILHVIFMPPEMFFAVSFNGVVPQRERLLSTEWPGIQSFCEIHTCLKMAGLINIILIKRWRTL